MVVAFGGVEDLRDFCLRDFVRIYTAHANPILVDIQHDFGGILLGLFEHANKQPDDKLHRCIIIIKQQHPILRGLFGLGPRLGRHPPLGSTLVVVIVHVYRYNHNP